MNDSFRDKYLLTASVRIDGTSRFSEKNKFATFPSASLGWKVSEEGFMTGQNFFTNLKLRVGYGSIGNQGINNFETIQTFRAGSNAVLGGVLQTGAIPARIPNEDLVWETTNEVNIGIDYGILGDRIAGSIELYRRNTFDQLFQQPLPLTTGFTSFRVNLGQVRNQGIDFNISTYNLTGAFKWNTDLMLSYLENEVIELPEFAQRIISGGFGFSGNYRITQEGSPMLSFFGYEIDGMWQEGDDIANSAQPNALPLYEAIRNANSLIDNIDNVTTLPAERTAALKGEAQFLRAFNYYVLHDLFGGGPLVKTGFELDLQIARATEQATSDFIVEDLTAAAQALPIEPELSGLHIRAGIPLYSLADFPTKDALRDQILRSSLYLCVSVFNSQSALIPPQTPPLSNPSQ